MINWSSDKVFITWAGLSFEAGLADGSFLRENRSKPAWTQKPNGYGDTIPMFNADRSGRVVLLIGRETETHRDLITISNVDQISRSVAAPLVARDGNTGIVSIYNKARIEDQPGQLYSTRPNTAAWVFIYAKAVNQPLTTPQPNQVGS